MKMRISNAASRRPRCAIWTRTGAGCGRSSAHHARVLEHRESLLERGDLRLAPLLALLEGGADVVARRAEIRNVLHDLSELLPIGGKLDTCVAEALVLLALLGLL